MFKFLRTKKKQQEQLPQFVIMNCVKACPRDEKKCPLWTVMYHKVKDTGGKEHTEAEGRCAVAWIPYVMAEFKNELITILKEKNNGDKK
jgi:hypothetical protein